MRNTGSPSWTVIIIALIIFWPVGIYLLFRRLNSDRSTVMGKQTATMVVGVVMLVGAFLMLLDGSMGACLFYLVGGLFLVGRANKSKKQGMHFRRYIDLVANQHVTSLDTIAQMTGQSDTQVAKDLEYMARHGYFPGAFVDKNTRQFVRPVPPPAYAAPQPGYSPQQQHVPQPQAVQPVLRPVTQPAAAPQLRAVTCQGCGANNMVVGTGVCEYCGSPL